MKILNLVYPNKSDITYKVSRFPDGQQNIVIYRAVEESDGVDVWLGKLEKHKVKILSRLNNFRDLELIICAVASLREIGVEEIHLYTPYIMGARSDRKFEEGGNNYLKDVICPIINSLNFKTVTCIDPHSDVLEACIKGFKKESNLELVKWVLTQRHGVDVSCGGSLKMLSGDGEDGEGMMYPFYMECKKCGHKAFYNEQNSVNGCFIKNRPRIHNDFILVSPDAGASKKIFKLAEQIGYKRDIITCSKDRDKDGKLTKTVVPNLDISKDLIIIDDICDGGATFINIAKEAAKQYPALKNPKIYLIVTHGIFSNGFEELGKYFDGIYCTNSYSDVAELTTAAINQPTPTKVKQLNIY